MSDNDKQALLDGSATIQTEIDVVDENITLTEDNSVVDWDYEDFRQVKDEGFIGQFVARQLSGTFKNLGDDFKITDKELELKLGVRKNDNTNWYSLGNFLVTKAEDDEVNDKTTYEALDYTKKFNKAYEDTIEYPCSALQLAQNVCNQCGVLLGNTNFKNNNYIIEGNVFTNNESCRDVLKAIGKLAGSWVRVDWDNKVYIDFDPTPFTTETTPSTYNEFGNNKYYELKTQKEKFGPVNRVVIGYSNIDGERTKIEDTQSIQENGLCEITIYDNPLVFTQAQRESIINSYSDLLGFTYTPLNTLTIGHAWLKGNELVRVADMEGVNHDTIPLDRTIKYFGHIKTLIDSTGESSKTNTEYAYTPEMTKQFAKTELMVDKQNQKIEGVIENVTEQNTKISRITQTVEQIESQITDIPTITTENSGTGSLYLSNLANTKLISLRIHPTDRDILGLFASHLLKASTTLKALSRGVTFDNTHGTENDLYYKLPDNLYYYDSETYDEFVYDGKEEKIYVIRKVAVDGQGNKSILSTPITEEYEYQDLIVESGDYNVFMSTYPTAYIYVKAMIKNDYTDLFATSYEVDTKISQTNKAIQLLAEEKVDENEIIAKLNVAVENHQGIVELVGNTVIIDSDKFQLDADGKITAISGDIGGFKMDSKSFSKELNGIYDYTLEDVLLLVNMDLGRLQKGTSIDYILDYNDDGVIDLFDGVEILRIINGQEQNTRQIKGSFEINSNDLKNCLVFKNNVGQKTTVIGLGGINTDFISANNIACGTYHEQGSGFTGCSINGDDGTITISDTNNYYDPYNTKITNKKMNIQEIELSYGGAKTIITAGQIILDDGQGHIKTITATS